MTKPIRCAIYTRKSSEEGLEQNFNSLDAQREACEAYVKSQVGEGWRALAARFDDGGFSGGTLQRPALQRLLGQIETGGIDVVVVYKVDRLTRSLLDFSKIVERFEAKGVSFVSVTQSFNTTSSMGRLTLNVLLSFAQFEREVTGERIRDKIAASKAKGLWMGGVPPLGYAADERTLKIVPAEAAIVQRMYAHYPILKSVPALVEQLDREGVRSRQGCALRHGAVLHILKSRLYLGEIPHKDRVYPGLHPAIVSRDAYDAVQAAIAANAGQRGPRPAKPCPSLLNGLVFDSHGEPMLASATRKGGRRYRYYVAKGETRGRRGDRLSVSADVLEHLAIKHLTQVLGPAPVTLRDHVKRIEITRATVTITLQKRDLELNNARARLPAGAALIESEGGEIALRIAVSFRRWAGAVTVFDLNGLPARAVRPDRSLIQALARARVWRNAILSGEAESFAAIARVEGVERTYVRRMTRLAYLAPDLARAVAAGAAPAMLNIDRFMRINLPRDWRAQRRLFAAVARTQSTNSLAEIP